MPGIFIPVDELGGGERGSGSSRGGGSGGRASYSDLEKLIAASRGEDAGALITVNLPDGTVEQFRFIPGDGFSPTERSFFLNPDTFHFPLNLYRLTSSFGMRVSPISGKTSMHGGLDLAAPMGTDVYAARGGIISESGNSPIYGNYIIITHKNGWTSLYGHLSAILTKLQSNVQTGELIGRVGNTGLSTGPHLHFELRQNGAPQDPSSLLKRGN
jgi:murein DD-endopeptidase MepM/ murein hydrolase activator NlpD